MVVLEIELNEVSRIVKELSKNVDFKKDLPSNVFIGAGYIFWFFERPLLAFVELFSDLILESFFSYGSGVFIKFSGDQLLPGSCIALAENDVQRDTLLVSNSFVDFFGGKFGYPVILFNREYDWIAFESAYEEFGVIAVKEESVQKRFIEYLEGNLISKRELVEWADGSGAESLIAKAFLNSYYS